NAELSYRLSNVEARVSAMWTLAPPAGGGDTSRAVARGTRAAVVLAQGPETRGRRRLSVEPRADADQVARAVLDGVGAWQAEFPGIPPERPPPQILLDLPPALPPPPAPPF